MALFSKAINFFSNSQAKYFHQILNIDIEFTKNNLRDKINFFYHNEKVNKFIQSILNHKLKKDIFIKSIK